MAKTLKYTLLSSRDNLESLNAELDYLRTLIGPYTITKVKETWMGDIKIHVKPKTNNKKETK